ncbi:ferric reductase-like transmembrane domain-containing protein [Ectobacillus funiculus]|uniref:Ferric reductase-like transmembrane domain-containing protein n=1 Tax=Ectobacillus funiculus TaxID=137993 RepID=A0ABV5WH31_9BACI
MQEYMWYLIRTTGLVAYLLMYGSVMVGLFSQIQKRKRKKMTNTLHVHEVLSNWTCILTIAHLALLFFDTYVSFDWKDLLIPFVTDYKPLSMAIGIFSLYLLMLTWITTKLRKQIGIRLWRVLHMFTPILYILVTIHGVWLGTDFQKVILLLLNIIPFASFVWMFLVRHDEVEKAQQSPVS